MKKFILIILDKLGYHLIKKENPFCYDIDQNELLELDNDIEEYIKAHPKNIGYENDKILNWHDKKVVRNYLSNKRIRQFHEIINLLDNNIKLSNKYIADIGSGTGYLLRLIAKKSPTSKLYGYDSYAELNKLATMLCKKAQFINKDIFDEFDQTFDIIFCTEVLEHITRPELIVHKLVNHLNKSGTLIITVPDGRFDQFESKGLYPNNKGYWGHINFWSIESWEVFLKYQCNIKNFQIGNLKNFNTLFAIIKVK